MKLKAMVSAMCRTLGENATISTGKGAWLVPRHFIALHVFETADLPKLAARFGFKQVEP